MAPTLMKNKGPSIHYQSIYLVKDITTLLRVRGVFTLGKNRAPFQDQPKMFILFENRRGRDGASAPPEGVQALLGTKGTGGRKIS